MSSVITDPDGFTENDQRPPSLKVTFAACLAESGSCIKTDAEGQSIVSFSVPATEIAEVVRLHLFRGRAFKVSIEP